MRQPSWRRWLGISLLGAGSVLGCRHAEHECDCCLATGRTVYMVPTPQPAMVAANVKPMPSAPVETPKVETTSAKNEALVDTTPVKRLEPTPATVTVPLVAGGDGGSKTGTLELSTADAEAMGVRPGYTPGALFMPPK